MTIDTKNMINSILESISRIDYIKPEDLPNIDLYGSGNHFYGKTACLHKTVSG